MTGKVRGAGPCETGNLPSVGGLSAKREVRESGLDQLW